MTAALLDPPGPVLRRRDPSLDHRLGRHLGVVPDSEPDDALVLYVDLNCPWSYLSFRRSRVLAAAGVRFDYRAVEHAPSLRPPVRGGDDFAALHDEMDRVVTHLLADEELPYDLAGFVPRTRAAIAAYAEGYAAGVSGRVMRVLFEAFWMHGIDIGDARLLRTLLVDELRAGVSPSPVVREWGYGVDVTGAPLSTAAWRLTRDWSAQWHDQTGTVPLLLAPDGTSYVGIDAVDHLGALVAERGLDPDPPYLPEQREAVHDVPDLRWVSEFGGAYLRLTEHHSDRGW